MILLSFGCDRCGAVESQEVRWDCYGGPKVAIPRNWDGNGSFVYCDKCKDDNEKTVN
jgi:hypothetical protein